MKGLKAILAATVIFGAVPAGAQSELEIPEELDRAFRDMLEDMKPLLDDALEFMEGFGGIDDPRHYLLPEVLPNGNIIIRRRPDAPDYVPPERELPEVQEDGSIKT